MEAFAKIAVRLVGMSAVVLACSKAHPSRCNNLAETVSCVHHPLTQQHTTLTKTLLYSAQGQ